MGLEKFPVQVLLTFSSFCIFLIQCLVINWILNLLQRRVRVRLLPGGVMPWHWNGREKEETLGLMQSDAVAGSWLSPLCHRAASH